MRLSQDIRDKDTESYRKDSNGEEGNDRNKELTQNDKDKRIRRNTSYLNISQKNGKTRIASINADSLRTNDAINRLTQVLHDNNIDVACIQETHNERIDTEERNGYVIFFGGNEVDEEIDNIIEKESRKAGVAIILKKTLLPYVKGIYKINGRMMEIRIKLGIISKIYQF